MHASIARLPMPGELLIASRALPRLGELLACLSPEVELRLLEGEADPLPPIAAALAIDALEALHLVGIGAPGELCITDAPAIDAEVARGLRPAASRRLEINLGASRVGAGVRGRHFLQVLAESTCARILASDGDVGGPDAGASWDLGLAARPRASTPFARPGRDALRLPFAQALPMEPVRT